MTIKTAWLLDECRFIFVSACGQKGLATTHIAWYSLEFGHKSHFDAPFLTTSLCSKTSERAQTPGAWCRLRFPVRITSRASKTELMGVSVTVGRCRTSPCSPQ